MAAYVCTRFCINKFKDSVRFIPRRYRVKTKWAATRPKFPATELALHSFDKTYSVQFGDLWPSIRVAMLCEQKYGALINSFSSASGEITDLEAEGCRDFITIDCSRNEVHKSSQDPTTPHNDSTDVESAPLQTSITPDIKCLVFPRGDISRFKPARPDSSGILGYYLLDAASVLPVLALDVRPGQTVLDLCAAPGGKTLALLQAHSVNHLWANDLSVSRTGRLRKILQSYVPKEFLDEENIHITCIDGRELGMREEKSFDRVLVDVPCTTDRHSAVVEENNIFKRSRTKERQKLPLLQIQLLVAGIQAARQGGLIVYSTCSLSQLQNECVVQQAISVAQEELGITVQVQDLRWFTQRFSDTFHFAPQLSVGELVLPHLCANFGPIYMCKLQRMN
nr:5-methylcytosine rRNA methyltransferase NSUN4 isoform X1 [Danio rerio]CAX12676.1 novel protein similar to H.sapiens NSUN4, NOL1/NOP2/Sun domain family, member 4 (NSUN4, zgc:101708) [Danio rerio]|eukprot:XP_021335728.1 5-methylcytosine rRNA methyltransferase NSUN4 isoform X1 [Danio rerio]